MSKNDPLNLEWTEVEELPEHVQTDTIITQISTKTVTHDDGDTVYVVFHLQPFDETLQRVLKGTPLEVSFPAKVNDESLLGKALKRSGMKADEVNLNVLLDGTAHTQIYRVEKRLKDGGEVKRFYQVERESIRFTPPTD